MKIAISNVYSENFVENIICKRMLRIRMNNISTFRNKNELFICISVIFKLQYCTKQKLSFKIDMKIQWIKLRILKSLEYMK